MSDITKSTWMNMMARCYKKHRHNYQHYGGRGIRVCRRWHKYENFLKDMGARPSTKHSIERIDNSKSYRMDNCKWATQAEQSRNRRSNRLLTFKGETKTLTEWCKAIGIYHSTVILRIQRGWTVDRALSTPASNKPRPGLRTHCPKGHPYSEENTWHKRAETGSERVCRTCRGLPLIVASKPSSLLS